MLNNLGTNAMIVFGNQMKVAVMLVLRNAMLDIEYSLCTFLQVLSVTVV